jgi:hypothetical protein
MAVGMAERCPFLLYHGAFDHGYVVSHLMRVETPIPGGIVIDSLDRPMCLATQSDLGYEQGYRCGMPGFEVCGEYQKNV